MIQPAYKPVIRRKIVFLLLCVIILLCAAAILIREAAWRIRTVQVYDEVADRVWEGQEPENTAAKETDQTEASLYRGMPPGLDQLMSRNACCVGWIHIDGTSIDHPIMQDPLDNGYYLHRDVNGEPAYSGSIFLDNNHSLDVPGIKLIYGHHMKAGYKRGLMFRDIVKFRSEEYRASHSDVIIWSGTAEYHYTPVGCIAVPEDTSFQQVITTREEMDAFLMEKCGVAPGTDKVLVLQTCSYGQPEERTYLICRLEETDLYR